MDSAKQQPVPACPYVGLQPYTEAEREYFFGREQDTETIAANLLTAPLTLLYGASGVGKTSVLAAGVVPYLRTVPDVLVVLFRSWQDETFLAALEAEVVHAANDVGTFLEDPERLFNSALAARALAFDQVLDRVAHETDRTLLIILDQFEEYFLYHSKANPFEEQFARAVNRGDVNANFVLSMREDALSQLDRFETRIPNLMSNYLRLEHLDRAGAARAIRKPLDVYNSKCADAPPIAIQDALVNSLIEQVQTGRVTLGQKAGQGEVCATPATDVRIETPFLQMVLTRLWEEETRTGSRSLRLETLNRLGGAGKITRTHLDTVMNRLRAPEQDICSTFFDRLVTPSGVKIAQNADDLVTYAARPADQVAPVLKKLADARVLRPIAPPLNQPKTGRFEIFHDVLAPAILDWRGRFVERKRVRRNLKRILLSALAVLVSCVILAYFVGPWVTAIRDVDPSILRVLQQVTYNTPSVIFNPDGNVLASSGGARIIIFWDVHTRRPIALSVPEHTGRVSSLAFSPDGKILASGSDDGTIILRNASTRQMIGQPLSGHKHLVTSLSFSPDSGTLASGGCKQYGEKYDCEQGEIFLWDVSTFKSSQPLTHNGSTDSLMFSPDGKVLASGSSDQTIILWDVNTRQPIDQPLKRHQGRVNSVAFSPDGKLLASGGDDYTIILWDVNTRQPIGQPLKGRRGPVNSVAFSRDGNVLASGSSDETIILWDVNTHQPIGQPLSAKGPVFSVTFSPDGKTLASASTNDTFILWDMTTDPPVGQPLTGN